MTQKALAVLALFLVVTGFTVRSDAWDVPIRNPYYTHPRWKLWFEDPSPVVLPDGKKIQLPPVEKRLFPDDPGPNEPGRFLVFRTKDWPGRKYAGMWDDVYSSRDKGHSFIEPVWSDGAGNTVHIRPSMITLIGGPTHALGANLTSQSTTGMGHDITNGKPLMTRLEQFFYFADMLIAGPAHVSYMNKEIQRSMDSYEALTATLYNSVGHSGSEEMALAKMVIAGAYLGRNLKPRLKVNGIYPSTLLYLWKAALPYPVPYDHELRHRVAYPSRGDEAGSWADQAPYPPSYDEVSHLRNMVNLAKALAAPPPEALVTLLENEGGETVYALKKTILVHQDGLKPVRLRVSTAESYDLDGRSLTFHWKVLYGNKDTTVRPTGMPNEFEIVAPPNIRLPKGRTSILLVADNGLSQGNPAVVNIFRTRGKSNQRPAVAGLTDRLVVPGETVVFDLTGMDPDGFPVTFYQRSGEVGGLDGSRFTWRVPEDHPDGEERVTLIASDGTNGDSYNSLKARFTVRQIAAEIQAEPESGPAPLTVRLAPLHARDKKSGSQGLSYHWDFNDGTESTKPIIEHTFDRPGFFETALTVSGPSGKYTTRRVIQALPDWPLVLFNGWRAGGPDPRLWTLQQPGSPIQVKRGVLDFFQKGSDEAVSLVSAIDFTPPFYLEAVFKMESSHKAMGFRILGLHLGESGKGKTLGRFTLTPAQPAEGEKPPVQDVAAQASLKPCRSLLKLFVEPDPLHTGRIRFRGQLISGGGVHFFRLDDQPMLNRKLEIMTGSRGRQFEVARFQIWTRPENAQGLPADTVPVSTGKSADTELCTGQPQDEYFQQAERKRKISTKLLSVEGNGLHIGNSDETPDPLRFTDFGSTRIQQGFETRAFTLYNLGPRPLTLGEPSDRVRIEGDGATAFGVSRPPRAEINGYGAADFEISFSPQEAKLYQAWVVLSHGKSDREYRFRIQGRGRVD